MLEQGYWVAGIIMAAAAVVGLFMKFKAKSSVETTQNADVSGSHNTVSQSAETTNGDK